MRWDPGYLCSGSEFEPFWKTLAADNGSGRRGLLIAGRGFDPRTTVGPQAIARSGFPITAFYLIRLTHPFDSSERPRNRVAAANEANIRGVFGDPVVRLHEIPVLNETGRLVGFPFIRDLFSDWNWLAQFTDVIVDITAFPTSISFPLLHILLKIADDLQYRKTGTFNLHCIICENADLDERITSEGGDVADFIEPFGSRQRLTSEADPITIWGAALGERESAALEKIYTVLGPAEVIPFLPSPSRNPRRGDELVSEYRSLLFGTWGVNPRGFIYVDERDPFDIYRQIVGLAKDYSESLELIGNANTIVSAHSSKLVSLGVLLAAFERNLAVAHVEPTGYGPPELLDHPEANELFEVWLTGEAYDPA